MNPRLELRPYQREAIDAIYEHFSDGGGNAVISVPTAGGKSVIIAEFIRSAIEGWPETNVLVLSHVAELLTQNYGELVGIWPDAPAGIYSASLNRRDLGSKIIFAGIQSIHRRAFDLPRIDLVIIDECHLVGNSADASYRRFLADLTTCNPYLKVIGFSATPYRLGSGLLTEGENALFSDIAYEANVRDLIEAGYLAPLVSRATETRLDVSGVGTRNGDYIAGELEAAVNVDAVTRAAVAEIIAKGQDRRSWLVFCAGIKHAAAVAEIMRGAGVPCETITGETPKPERAAMLRDFTAGRIRCLTNANVLTTGINVRPIDLLAFLRPTKSTALYIQMAGRAMRLSPETGKVNGLVLDFAGLVATHGPIDMARPRAKGQGGPAPTKECPSCETILFAGLRSCPECGHEFEFVPQPPAIHPRADDRPILSTEAPPPPQWLDVSEVSYHRHTKPGKPPSMRVDYRCGLVVHREWVCLEHDGYARQKAVAWWVKRAPGVAVPGTIAEGLALADALARPVAIMVRITAGSRFTEVSGVRF